MMDLTEYVILPGADYKAACDAVREKTGKTDGIKSGALAAEIRGITPKLQEKTVSPGTEAVSVAADAEYEGLSAVTVQAVQLQKKSAAPTEEEQTILPEEGYLGLSSVTVDAMKLQEKTVVPSDAAQTITPDAGFHGLAKVLVEAAQIGTPVRIATGENLFGSVAKSINVGFRPDFVVLDGFSYSDERKGKTFATQLACLFDSPGQMRMVATCDGDYWNLEGYITQTSTGFRVDRIYAWTLDGTEKTYSTDTFAYTAVKYTE